MRSQYIENREKRVIENEGPRQRRVMTAAAECVPMFAEVVQEEAGRVQRGSICFVPSDRDICSSGFERRVAAYGLERLLGQCICLNASKAHRLAC